MKKVWNYVVTMWQPATLALVACLGVVGLYSYRIASLVQGKADIEIATQASSSSLKNIFNNPINAPYKLTEYVAHTIHGGITAGRLVAGLIAVISVFVFYLLASRFMKKYAAFAATILYATSSSLLQTGRLISSQIMLLVLLTLFLGGYYLRFSSHIRRSLFYAAGVVSISLYTPGILYFLVAGAVWQYRSFKRTRELPDASVLIICGSIILAALAPLVYAMVKTPELWHEYFAIPNHLAGTAEYARRFAAVPFGIFVRAPENPLFRLGKQPTLDIFTGFMCLIGAYHLIIQHKLDRLTSFAGVFVLGGIMTTISGNYENTIVILPFIFILVGLGINHLLRDWDKVFPHNPLARWLALIIMSLTVITSVNFQMRRYFIAWPHNSKTKAVFQIK